MQHRHTSKEIRIIRCKSMGQVHCSISSHTTNSSRIILTSTTNSDTANMIAIVGLAAIILVCLAFLIRAAVLRLMQPRPPNMSVPVEESLDYDGMFPQHPYNQIVVVGRSLTTKCPLDPSCSTPNNHLVYSHVLPSIPSCYIGLYLPDCAEQIPEDVPIHVQESIQCSTNKGKAVTVIGDKDYRPPAED